MAVSNEVPDTVMKVYANGWVATIVTGESFDGFYPVYVMTVGNTKEMALAGAVHVLNALAFGREALIRCEPEAFSEMDFDTKITNHGGFVRFSYKLEPGVWQKVGDMEGANVGAAVIRNGVQHNGR